MKLDKFIARRYLKARRKQAFIGVISIITLVGITLGVAALNIGLAAHNGMRKAFIESLIGKTGQLYILAGNFSNRGFGDEELQQVATVLKSTPGVTASSAMREESGVLVSQHQRLVYVKLQGINPADHLHATDTFENMVSGSPSSLSRQGPDVFPGLVVGADMARNLGVQQGDFIRLALPRISSSGLSTRDLGFRMVKCEIVGIFKTGNSQFDEMDAYIQLDNLLELLNTDRVDRVLVRFSDMAALERAKLKLASNPDLPFMSHVADLRDLNQGLLKALKLEKMMTTILISLFILIVALNMVSALIMMIMEKHRDIGVMKSFGTPSNTILWIFIRQGMTLAIRGTLLGSTLGVSLSLILDRTQAFKLDNDVYEVLNYLPFQVNPLEVALVAIGSLLLCLITTIYPARQAAALDPVEALVFD